MLGRDEVEIPVMLGVVELMAEVLVALELEDSAGLVAVTVALIVGLLTVEVARSL